MSEKIYNPISNSNAERLEEVGIKAGVLAGESSKAIVSRRNSNVSSACSSGTRTSFWSNLAKKDDVWDEWGDVDELDHLEDTDIKLYCKHIMKNVTGRVTRFMKYIWKSLQKHPYIGIVTLASFVIICVIFISTTMAFANQYSEDLSNAALDVAVEQGQLFSDQLDSAIWPLFSMAQFVMELSYFADLPFEIGPGGEEGSAPYVAPFIERDGMLVYTHRNVTGICDDPELVENFNRIARNIKEDAKMERVLVNIQLAPQAVVCLLYPMVNTEDFDPPTVMDNTGAWGHDLLQDPARRFIAEATVPADGVVAVGPLTLRQCIDCDPVVKDAIIARLPINFPPELGYNINVNGQNYSSWGFTVALINWGALVERSDVFTRFKVNGMDFILSSTNKVFNEATQDYDTVRKTLAMSDNAMNIGTANFVNTTLQTTMNLWEMAVGYENGLTAPWMGGAIAVSVILSLVLSLMMMLTLVEKQNHLDLLKEMLPKKALKKVQKGETCVERYRLVTIFFSDIVGYTTMSSQMSPIQVMKMLNQFYCEVDIIADKNKVYKIEVIGDAYMCVVGCPDPCMGPEGAERMALFALDLIELVKNFRMDDGSKIFVRAGIHSGPVVGGVVGTRRPQWTIFGDTVNTASRMESTSKQMMIQCSDMTHRLLQDAPNYTFQLTDRGHVEAKGKGKMHTWFIEGATLGRHQSPQDHSLHSTPPLTLDGFEDTNSNDDQKDDCDNSKKQEHNQDVELQQHNYQSLDTIHLQKDIDIKKDDDDDNCSIDSMAPMDR